LKAGIPVCPNGKIGYISLAKFGSLYGLPPWIETGGDCNRNVAYTVQDYCKNKTRCEYTFDYKSLII